MTSDPTLDRTATIDSLVRGLYDLSAIKRDTMRRALGARALPGLAALATLHHHGPLRVSGLAEALHVDLSVASRQVASLEAAGHVARRPDPLDRRSQTVALTDAGRAALTEAHERMVDALAATVAGWESSEVATLALALGRLREDYAAAAAADRAGAPTTLDDQEAA